MYSQRSDQRFGDRSGEFYLIVFEARNFLVIRRRFRKIESSASNNNDFPRLPVRNIPEETR